MVNDAHRERNAVLSIMTIRTLIVLSSFLWVLFLPSAVLAGQAPIRVVATIFPLTDIVREIGGTRVYVTTLLTGGMSEHTFEPTTSQIRQMAYASLYVRVGAQMDTWGDKLLAAAKRPPVIVTATSGIPLLSVHQQELEWNHRAGGHQHEGDDPHVWLDPVLVRDHVVPAVVDALIRISPKDAPYFRANGGKYILALSRLDQDMRTGIGSLSKKDFIALHGAWHYLAKRYGLRQIAAVEPFPGKEPSAKYLAALVSLARKKRVTTIFAEPQLSAKAAEVIARELKGRVLLLDPLGGEMIRERNGYIPLMRYNLSIIARGMK
ncbi:MAG: periplasmic solute binding protein [Geobacteraceae bacterium]|jgi:zinc transport system substrate-binding protein|nr:periplasmic solute binding protein [Geobacteraceae bacterium]